MLWTNAIKDTLSKTKQNIERFNCQFPHVSEDKKYILNDNTDWTNGFWSGILWLSYEFSKDEHFKTAAQTTVMSFKERMEKNVVLDMHDIGFLYTPSSKAQWMIEHDECAKDLTLLAADKLMKRYRPHMGIIQAWGPKNDPENGGRIIIDCLMNMPLLFWASDETGDEKYRAAAISFIDKARKFLMRGDDSSYHTFYFDQKTGDALRGATQQGYGHGSTWARGQAWAIYGFILAYYFTKDKKYLETSLRSAHYFLKHLPANYIAYWDFDAPLDDQIKPDSSASAIAVCGIHELLCHLDEDHPDITYLQNAMEKMMVSLIENCATNPEEQGFIDHGSYSVRENLSPDDYVIWGDYFYLEALMRLKTGNKGYWF